MIGRLGLAGLAAASALTAARSVPAAEPAAEVGFACPAVMAVRQNRAVLDLGDWKVGVLPGHRRPRPGRHALSGLSFSEGPPEERALLAPDDSREEAEGGFVNRWTFGPSALGYWLVCEYETSGVFLQKRLGPEIGRCAVRYGSDAKPAQGDAVSCGPP